MHEPAQWCSSHVATWIFASATHARRDKSERIEGKWNEGMQFETVKMSAIFATGQEMFINGRCQYHVLHSRISFRWNTAVWKTDNACKNVRITERRCERSCWHSIRAYCVTRQLWLTNGKSPLNLTNEQLISPSITLFPLFNVTASVRSSASSFIIRFCPINTPVKGQSSSWPFPQVVIL